MVILSLRCSICVFAFASLPTLLAGQYAGELKYAFRHDVQHDARAFFQRQWHPEVGCSTSITRLGNRGDGGKILCNPAALSAPDCLVVSIGSHGDYSFEIDVHALAPHCEIHTYDGTLSRAQRARAPPYVQVFVRNMTRTTYREYAGQRVDVLKIDCEGCEFSSLLPWVNHVCTENVMLELHACHKNKLSRGPAVANGFAWRGDTRVIEQADQLLRGLSRTHAIYFKEPNIEWSDGTCIEYSLRRRWPQSACGERTSTRRKMLIPRLISQTGPPDPALWNDQFRRANGSWQRFHPRWRYTFWNDSSALGAENPNMEAFVARHFHWFLPTWHRLCYFIMRLDVARYMWMYVHGGVYADLDLKATGNMTKHLLGAEVVLPANSTTHARERGCWRGVSPRPPGWPQCGTDVGNWWMASVAGHPIWLEMLRYIEANVELMCRRNRKHYDVLELTGPFGLGRVVEAHLRARPENGSAIRFLPLKGKGLVFATYKTSASWHGPRAAKQDEKLNATGPRAMAKTDVACYYQTISALPPARQWPYQQCLRKYPDSLSDAIKRHGRWGDCDHLVELWRKQKVTSDRAIFVDAGANIGSCSLLMLSQRIVTHAFEPLPANQFYFKASVRRNAGFAQLLTLHDMGLGAKAGSFPIFSQKGNAGNSVLGVPVSDSGKEKMMGKAAHIVNVSTLDDELWPDASAPPPLIPVMKIDVQGFEVNLLRGARRLLSAGAVRTIKFEVAVRWLHGQNTTARMLLSELRQHGYHILKSATFTTSAKGHEFRVQLPYEDGDLDRALNAVADFVATLDPK